jgi:hypothetical protein
MLQEEGIEGVGVDSFWPALTSCLSEARQKLPNQAL